MSRRKQKEGGVQPRRKKQKENGMTFRVLKILAICLLVAFAALAVLAIVRVGVPVISMYRNAVEMVAESDENTFKAEQTSLVYDADGNEIKKLKGEKDVHYLEYEDIPDAAKLALIAIEDKNFTSHRGIDMEGIARAAVALIRNRGEITQGGSTITQQLARNVFLSFETTYSRKIQEMFIAVALEQKYTKEQILEFYLNNVYFSNGYYGIESASEAYFRKEAKDLTISQIAFLCAIPNSPTRYDPYDHPEATMERRDRILKNMYEEGYISEEQYQKSLDEKIEVLPRRETQSNDYAETYIIKCATESLMKERGFEFQYVFDDDEEEEAYDEEYDEMYSICRQSLYTAGYRIYTSIDMDMQSQLQESVSSQLAMFTDKTDDGIYEVQGAAVCIDNSTGRVAAIVGGREADQEGYGLNRAYQSYRQPGSAIKPLLVYAPALEQGYTAYSTVDDSRMTGEDAVSNSGYSYSGSISLRRAVQKSSNVATYRLYQELGPEDCLKYLENMNFAGLEPEDYRYDTTCLGGFTRGTTAVEMAAGYATLANDGRYRTPTCIIRITDSEGNVIVPNEEESKEIYSSSAARSMTDILESCVTDSSATASGCDLDVDTAVACKTGTTSNYVDGWLCGYSPYYTTAVWVGMDVYEPVDGLTGSSYPEDIWKNFMDKVHVALPERDFDGLLSDDDSDSTEARATTEEEADHEVKMDEGNQGLEEMKPGKDVDEADEPPVQTPDTGSGTSGGNGASSGGGTSDSGSSTPGGSQNGGGTSGGSSSGGTSSGSDTGNGGSGSGSSDNGSSGGSGGNDSGQGGSSSGSESGSGGGAGGSDSGQGGSSSGSDSGNGASSGGASENGAGEAQ
ncbi:MAG: penicillin-binding protein [Clostridiales bacterium]|nr:penicillin-binding protein [Clostridiales bacterium]